MFHFFDLRRLFFFLWIKGVGGHPVAGKNWVYFAGCLKFPFQRDVDTKSVRGTDPPNWTRAFSSCPISIPWLFFSNAQPSCSCTIPPWVLILFSIPVVCLDIQYTVTRSDLLHGSPIDLPLANWNIMSLASHSHVRSWTIASHPLHSQNSAYWKKFNDVLINFNILIIVSNISFWFEFQ